MRSWLVELVFSDSRFLLVLEEGQKLISDLLGGDIDAFIDAKRAALVADINGMHAELGRSGQVTDRVITDSGRAIDDNHAFAIDDPLWLCDSRSNNRDRGRYSCFFGKDYPV